MITLVEEHTSSPATELGHQQPDNGRHALENNKPNRPFQSASFRSTPFAGLP